MSYNLTSPLTGAAQTGLTSPTYTLTSDVAPDVNGKQWAVTALGGTQTGVVPSTVNLPFTITMYRPKVLQILGAAINGIVARIPRNVNGIVTRKGVAVNAAQSSTVVIRTTIDTPAGSETYDNASVKAALSAHIGALSQASSGIGDTVTNGVM